MQVLRQLLFEMYTVNEVNIGLCNPEKIHKIVVPIMQQHWICTNTQEDLNLNAQCDLAQMEIARCP